MKKPRVVLADDHKMFLSGLRSLLDADFEVVGAVEDGRALLTAAERLQPDVLVVDISMPLLNGFDAARQLRKSVPNAKLIFLTMHTDVRFVHQALRVGARGYVVKQSAPAELVTAIHEVLQGRVYVTPFVTKAMVSALLDSSGEPEPAPLRLTPRQQEVLRLVAEGRSLKEMAATLNISMKTVEFHKYRLMEELGVRTTAELMKFAIKHRLDVLE